MKKKVIAVGMIFAIAASIIPTGCKKRNEEHRHNFGAWETTVEATCTQAGVKKRKCECGNEQTEAVPAAGHRGSGYTGQDEQFHWKICNVCGEEFEKETHRFENGKCTVCDRIGKIPAVLKYQLNDAENGYIVAGIESGNELTQIPSSYLSLPVTEIGAEAFRENVNLTKIVIPDSVVKIGEKAFSKCANLTEVTFGNGLEVIGESAFQSSAVKNLILPDSLTTVNDLAFANITELEYADIPKMTKLKGNTFWKSGIKKVKINGSTSGWGNNGTSKSVFLDCDNLLQVIIGADAAATVYYAFDDSKGLKDYIIEDNPNFSAEGGVLYNADGTKVLRCARGRESASVREGTTEIGLCAFQACKKLKNISLPESLQKIGELSFNAAAITELTIPDGVTRINKDAFANCAYLEKVEIGKGLRYMENNVFNGCTSLKVLTVSEDNADYSAVNGSLVSSGGGIDGKNRLIRANLQGEIPSGVNHIYDIALCDCKEVEEIVIPASVKTIDINAFLKCTKLKRVRFENTSGWTVTKNGESYPSQAVAISVSDVATNAEYLLTTYSSHTWRRSDS